MLEGKAVIEETDMPLMMQTQATASASKALDLYEVSDCTNIAAHIKKEFDEIYGCGWQCVVGTNLAVSSPISLEISSTLLLKLSTFSSLKADAD